MYYWTGRCRAAARLGWHVVHCKLVNRIWIFSPYSSNCENWNISSHLLHVQTSYIGYGNKRPNQSKEVIAEEDWEQFVGMKRSSRGKNHTDVYSFILFPHQRFKLYLSTDIAFPDKSKVYIYIHTNLFPRIPFFSSTSWSRNNLYPSVSDFVPLHISSSTPRKKKRKKKREKKKQSRKGKKGKKKKKKNKRLGRNPKSKMKKNEKKFYREIQEWA